MLKKYLSYLLLLLVFCSNLAYTSDSHEQRQLFYQARQLLLAKHYRQFEQLSDDLKSYSLYPYLAYIKLKQRLAYAKVTEIDNFLLSYKNTPLANKLRTEYLIEAIKRDDWTHFIYYYRPTYEPPLQCYYLHALLETQQKKIAYQAIPKLWLTLNAPPDICDRVFKRWEHAGRLTHALLWEKLQQAIQYNNVHVLQHLGQRLAPNQRQQLKLWYQVHNDPLLVEHTEQFDIQDPIDKKIFLYGLHRLASKNPSELIKTWAVLTKKYSFTEVQKQSILSSLAISLARRADINADIWLKKVSPAYANALLREWRVRNALLKGNWQHALYWINHLTQAQQKLPCWCYWKARALAATQQTEAANVIYKSLATKVDYYGVLASERLKKRYAPTTQAVLGNAVALQQNHAIQRAQELYLLGFIDDARREWFWVLPHLSIPQRQAAAQLAKRWQWYDLAIITAAKANIHNDIRLRFPMAYRALVLANAKKLHLNAAWIWAIMRQESAFMWNAKSSVGALGLMQIMPKTGKTLAKNFNLEWTNLLDPKLNIHLGAAYLKYLLKSFDGNFLLATAAYNIGPTRIKNYQALYQYLPQDVWVEILPWKETRDYVKSVSLARNIYGQI